MCLLWSSSHSLLIAAVFSCLAQLPVAIDDFALGTRVRYLNAGILGICLECLPLKWFPLCAFPVLFWIFYFDSVQITFRARHLFASVLFLSVASHLLVLREFMGDHELFLMPVPSTPFAINCNLFMLGVLFVCAIVQYWELRTQFGSVSLSLPLFPKVKR